jgi:hypothetical protein
LKTTLIEESERKIETYLVSSRFTTDTIFRTKLSRPDSERKKNIKQREIDTKNTFTNKQFLGRSKVERQKLKEMVTQIKAGKFVSTEGKKLIYLI